MLAFQQKRRILDWFSLSLKASNINMSFCLEADTVSVFSHFNVNDNVKTTKKCHEKRTRRCGRKLPILLVLFGTLQILEDITNSTTYNKK